MINPFVIVIAGPTGVGKTTLAKMLSKHYGCISLSEDEITKEIYPDTYKDVENYPDKVKIAESQLLKRTKEIFNNGECIVVDLINLRKEFIEEIGKTFHKQFVLKVLWPSVETIIERDKKRKSWTSGEKTITRFYKKYEELKPIIGEENYIDNSDQTPEKVLEKFIDFIEQDKWTSTSIPVVEDY